MGGEQDSASRTCPKCGERFLGKNRVFCPSCGVNIIEYASSNKPAETNKSVPERDIPDQPTEVLKELLRETRHLAQVVEKSRLDQKKADAQQLEALKQIKTATNVWLLLVVLSIVFGCLFGSGILGGF